MLQYDIIIVGASVEGLWLANRLRREGYNLIVIDEGKATEQTMHAPGIITDLAFGAPAALAGMPARWEACFGGWGDIDLTNVELLTHHQILCPSDESVSGLVVAAAAKSASLSAIKMKVKDFPRALSFLRNDKKRKSRLFTLPEKVPDTSSLIQALLSDLEGRVLCGEVQELLPDGQIAISGMAMRAQLIVFAAGAENARAFEMMRIREKRMTVRQLRHITVRPMLESLFLQTVTSDLSAHVTISSHSLHKDQDVYAWKLGGALSVLAGEREVEDALCLARSEMQSLFPRIDWESKIWEYADTWRVEPYGDGGTALPPGAHVHQRGKVLITSTPCLAFAPEVCDRVLRWMQNKDIVPVTKTPPPPLRHFASSCSIGLEEDLEGG